MKPLPTLNPRSPWESRHVEYLEEAPPTPLRLGVMMTIFTIVLNVILIQRYGLMGSAVAAVLAFAVAFAMAWWLARRAFPLPRWPAGTWRVLLGSGIMCLALAPIVARRGAGALAVQVAVALVSYGAAAMLLDIAGAREEFRHFIRGGKMGIHVRKAHG